MDSFIDKIKKAALEAVAGIIIGGMLNYFKEYILSLPNGGVWIALFEILPVFVFLREIEIIDQISWSSAIGYFFVVFTVGQVFMPDWEIVLNIILAIVYALKKIESYDI